MLTDIKSQSYNLEIWGGVECTVNRVEDTFRNQLCYTQHDTRLNDIEQFAALGIKALRYPVLWELHEQEQHKRIDWTCTTERLNSIRQQGIIPIAGLVHHGSGPIFTNLLDDNFPNYLAAYAHQVVKQFPWIDYYTPVNEPLTTARFSGLYGFWYPHHRDPLSFVTMLLNQVKGVVLAMQEIRKINPNAGLVQTEDLTRIHSTPCLSYQADFENERRWLTYDLLCGKVNKSHALWDYLIFIGIKESMLSFFLENTCPPDIMGLNYYVTSERYLDENITNYPHCNAGGNGKHTYVDVEAVRVGKQVGLAYLLAEVWDRYQLPMAITETHLNCTREEQMRWFKETWDSCCLARKEGIDVKAVTAWSLLGACDWDSLLTKNRMHYEIGIFDVRNNSLRPTATARLISALTKYGKYDHPLLENKGWWHRTDNFINGSTQFNGQCAPVLIIGQSGTLGNAFAKICEQRAITYKALSRTEITIEDEQSIKNAIDLYKPWAIINATGYVKVDDAENDQEQCFITNAVAPGLLAKVCRMHGIQFMTFSSDLVFDGSKQAPYHEFDSVKPLNVYGMSKATGEELVMAADPSSLIIRTSAFFGPWDNYNFAHYVLRSLQEQRTCCVVDDVIVSPTYVPDLVHAALDLLIDESSGIWHLSNEGKLSWAEFAYEVAERGGYKKDKVITKSLNEMKWKANRPPYSVLQSGKGIVLPEFESALHRYFEEKCS